MQEKSLATVQRGVLGLSPEEAQTNAMEAIKWVRNIIEKRPDKLVVRGKQYIELQDWEFIGLYFGVYSRTESTEYLYENTPSGQRPWGVKAICSTYDRQGNKLSTAIMECTKDEPQFEKKPMNQISAMAQTRGCRRAFIQTLRWVFDISSAHDLEVDDEPPVNAPALLPKPLQSVSSPPNQESSAIPSPNIDLMAIKEQLDTIKENDVVRYQELIVWLSVALNNHVVRWSDAVTQLDRAKLEEFIDLLQ